MTTHTPGPFEIDTDRSILCRPQADRYGRDMISDVLPIAGVYSWMGPEEADANARLFGAAPDLLTACRTVKALLDVLEAETDSADPFLLEIRRQTHAPLRAALDPAIAKADGLAVETKGSIY